MSTTVENLSIGGGELAIEFSGPETGTLVICSPGMGDTRDSFAPLASTLASSGYRVATFDPRGHGDSSATFTSYGDLAAADDFLAIANKYSPSKPVVLAGVSFSTAGATIAAGKEPERVSKIVLMGPYLRNPMGAFGLYLTSALFARPWGAMVWQTYAASLWPGLGAEGAKKKAAASRASLTRPKRWAAFQATVAGCDHGVVAPYFENVKAKALIVMGDKDPDWTKPVVEAEWCAKQFAGSEMLIVPGIGHAPQLEATKVVVEKMLEFLVSN